MDQRQLLADTVDRVLRSLSPEAAFDASWQRIAEIDLPRMLVRAEAGGFGGTWEDMFPVLHAVGRHCSPLPIGESILAHRVADAAGLPLAGDAATIGVDCAGRLESRNGSYWFTGVAHAVPWGRFADRVVLIAPLQGQPHVVVVGRRDGLIQHGRNLADEPRDRLTFENAAAAVAPAVGEGRTLIHHGALLRVVQMAGALETALQRSVDHARERKQFGRPIGQFQAVQQDLARFGEECAAASCAARAACRAAAAGNPGFAIAAAKLRANAAAATGTAIAHQVHAAMGFTREFGLRQATQRLWSWRSEYGSEGHWSQWLGERALLHGAEHLWSDLTSRDDATAFAVQDRVVEA